MWMIFPAAMLAQKTVKLCGEYVYIAPENVTPEQAKQTALERAKLNALADRFGTNISQLNTTLIENQNEKSNIKFLAMGGSEVKGEWIEDTKPPVFEVDYSQNGLTVKVSVCGTAREIKGAKIDFTARILRNGVESRYESSEFRHGDDVFLLFKSPVDGYLAVYLMDDMQNVFCLLPYRNDAAGKTQVKAGKEYVFFSAKHAEKEMTFTDEYMLTCNKSIEQNFIYIVFSPNEFTKANDTRTDRESVLPRELSFDNFQQWLAKNRVRDKDMSVETKILTIKK